MGTMNSCRFFTSIVLALTVLVLARCGLEQAQAPSGTFRSVFQAFESNNCAECHAPTAAAYAVDGVQMDLSAQAAAYSDLTTKNSFSPSTGDCAGIKLVTGGDLSKSYFAAVLLADVATDNFAGTSCTPCSEHHTSQNLTDAQKTSIRTWIENGAPND